MAVEVPIVEYGRMDVRAEILRGIDFFHCIDIIIFGDFEHSRAGHITAANEKPSIADRDDVIYWDPTLPALVGPECLAAIDVHSEDYAINSFIVAARRN